MQCLLCGKKIPLLRKLKDPDFCSEAHRDEYAQTQSSLALSRLLESTRSQGKSQAAEAVPAGKVSVEDVSDADVLAAVSRASGPKEIYVALKGNEAHRSKAVPRAVSALPVRTKFLLVAPRVAVQKKKRRDVLTAGLVELIALPVSGTARSRGAETAPVRVELEVAIPLHDISESTRGMPENRQDPVRQDPPPVADGPPAQAVPLRKDWVSSQEGQRSVAHAPAAAPVAHSTVNARPPSGLTVMGIPSAPADGTPGDPPLARAREWGEAWKRGWSPRNQIQDMRRLWALPVIAAGTRAPQIRPAFSADLELSLVSDPVAAALTSGSGMLALRPPRSKPPLPPKLAKVAHGDESLLWEPAMRIGPLCSAVPTPAFSLGASSLPKLIRAATGNRGALALEAPPQLPDGLSGVPLVNARLRGWMDQAAKIRLSLPQAEWGDGAIWIAPEALEFKTRAANFGTLRLPPIVFDPPLNGLLALRIYPRSAGSPGEWKRSDQPAPLELRFAGVAIPDSGLVPERDYIGVGAGCVPLPLPPMAANRMPFPGRMDPEAWGAIAPAPATGGCRLSVAPIRSVAVRAIKMTPIRRGPQARQHEVQKQTPAAEPFFRVRVPVRARLRVAPKAECLRRPVAPPPRKIKLALPSVLGPLRKQFAKIPRRVRLGVFGVAAAAMLFTIFWEPSNPGKTAVGSPKKVAAAQRKKPVKPEVSWLQSMKGKVAARSAVAVTDDFSHGLADWEGRGDWGSVWGYDNAGFVRTGPLAIFTPTRELTDYRMEFVGQIERRSLGWVVRAADLSNYWALKLIVGGTDARPTVTLVRYPVIRGAAGRMVERVVDLPLQADTTYRVSTVVGGDNYAVTVQGKVADSWTDSRLDRGGVGFFNNKGEQARVRWVGVWHQYDTLGRLCALLSSNSLLGNEREE